MIGTIDQCCLNADNRIAGQRSFLDTFLDTFFHCREEVLRNGTAEDLFFKYVRSFKIS